MLVITRKEAETFTIGDDIEVTVVRISGNKVSIGISAPRNMVILRDDIKNANPVNELSSNPEPLHSVRTSEIGQNSPDPYSS